MHSILFVWLALAARLPQQVVGDWVETREWSHGSELKFAVVGDELHGVLRQVDPKFPSQVWAEFVIARTGRELSLKLKEGARPYECLFGNPRGLTTHPGGPRTAPCYYGDKTLDWKRGGATHVFHGRRPEWGVLRFELEHRGSRGGMYAFIIEFHDRDGHMHLRSVFGPQHGAALESTYIFERRRSGAGAL